jgi:hypothetical protein
MRGRPVRAVRASAAALVVATCAAACTYDFGAPFSENARADGGKAEGGMAGEGGIAPTECPFGASSAYATATKAEAYYRLDESAGPFNGITSGSSAPPKGTVTSGRVTRVPRGALREKNGAQRLERGTISFGNTWGELGGGTNKEQIFVELWVSVEPGIEQVIFSKGHDAGGFVGFRLLVTTAGILRYERRSTTGATLPLDVGPFAPNRFHHLTVGRIALIANDGNLDIRLDGASSGKYADDMDPGKHVTTTDDFVLGPLDGIVDELAIYKTLGPYNPTRVNAASSADCAKVAPASLCFGATAIGICGPGQAAAWTKSCASGEICFAPPNAEARCVPDPCGP